MTRVAFGSVPKDGGTFTFYRALRPALLERGIDLRCVSVGRDQAELTESAFVDDGCVQLAPGTGNLKSQAQAFADWVRDEGVDIVFGVNSHGILSALPHLPERVRVLARCANGFDEGYRLTLVGNERLAKIVALVPRLRDDLVEKYGIDPSRIALIPNGASAERFGAAASLVRGTGDRIELGFLGRLEHTQKGVMHLPAVLDRLDASGVPYRLSIAGKGKHEAGLRDALAARQADGRVRFVGSLKPNEIPDFLGGTDVFLFPSHFEGCPNALLEAMMAGTVPISWALPGITDFLLDDGRTGFLAPMGDTLAFASAVERLATDRALLREASERGAREARRRFSTEICAASYVDLLGQVMSEPPPAWKPVPWSGFKVDPMFRQSPLARILPPRQREKVRAAVRRLGRARHGRTISGPGFDASARCGIRVHQIINGIDTRLGGAQRLARQLHEELLDRGVDARLVALEACPTNDLRGCVSLGLSSPYDPRALLRLSSYARDIGPEDIVHVHLFPASAHVSALSRAGLIGGNLVFTEHSTSNRRRSHLLGGLIDDRVYGPFKRIVAISEGVRDELLRAHPELAPKTIVIENGCRLRFTEPPDRNREARPLHIVSVGRLVPAKNYDLAIRAMAHLASTTKLDFLYSIAGDGPERQALDAKVREFGLIDRVRLMGHVDDVATLLESADIFLMPSAWEGFGLAAVEAMNAALPVVVSNVAGLREVVGRDGEAGMLADPNSPEAFSAALRALMEDGALRRTIGLKGFDRAKRFDLDRFVAGYIDLYSQLGGRLADAA